MNKYNNMKSISFSELSEEEIEQTIREWSQGNIHMEKLLWACREHGVETHGCNPLGRPYLEIVVNNSHKKIKQMLNAAQSIQDSMILVMPDKGDPANEEETWSCPIITIIFDTYNKKKINECLDKLYEAIVLEEGQDKPENEIFAYMLDFYDIFAGRGSGLRLSMTQYKVGEYQLDIVHKGDRTDFTYYDNLFKRAGIRSKGEEWKITDNNEKLFEEKIKKAKTTIMEEYSFFSSVRF